MRKSTESQRRDWLKSHPEYWNMRPSRIVKLMAADGLCSAKTTAIDLRIEWEIEELREESTA